jgi:hypothetical protein
MKEAALFVMSEYYWAPLNVRIGHYQQISQDPKSLFDAILDALIQSTADDSSRPWLAERKCSGSWWHRCETLPYFRNPC